MKSLKILVLSCCIIGVIISGMLSARESIRMVDDPSRKVIDPNTIPTMDLCFKAYESWDSTSKAFFRSAITLIDANVQRVLITKYGTKYHDPDVAKCSYTNVNNSKAISKEEAIKQGYTPCSRCMKDN